MLHLKRDTLITDFCGDNLTPGWLISREKKPGENWVKYSFTLKGPSGSVKTTLIGDFLTHQDLTELEQERVDYFKKVELKKNQDQQNETKKPDAKKSSSGSFWGGKKAEEAPVAAKAAEVEAEKVVIDADYVPIDFDSYSIGDKDHRTSG